MRKSNVIPMRRAAQPLPAPPADMFDTRFKSTPIREVPVDGPTHELFKSALAALNYVPLDLDTIQELERFRNDLYVRMHEMARHTGLPMGVMVDIIRSVDARITKEMEIQP